MLASNFCFSFVVRLLQAISTVRHRHGESTAQTAGRVWSLDEPPEPPEHPVTYTAVWLQKKKRKKKKKGEMRMDHVERIRKRAETTGTPLCCTRWRQKKNPKISTPNECCCCFFFFFNLCRVCWQVGTITRKKKSETGKKVTAEGCRESFGCSEMRVGFS